MGRSVLARGSTHVAFTLSPASKTAGIEQRPLVGSITRPVGNNYFALLRFKKRSKAVHCCAHRGFSVLVVAIIYSQ